MRYNPDIHHRQSIRLKGYDYSSVGTYFITICTKNMECLFGEVVEGKMVLNDVGRIVENEWLKTSIIRKNIELDEFIIMSDHMHGIIKITEGNTNNRRGDSVNRPVWPVEDPADDHGSTNDQRVDAQSGATDTTRATHTQNRATHRVAPTLMSGSIGSIIGQYKSVTTKQVNRLRNSSIISIWQRNYYDEIIHNEKQLNETRKYIINNPIEWELNKKIQRI